MTCNFDSSETSFMLCRVGQNWRGHSSSSTLRFQLIFAFQKKFYSHFKKKLYSHFNRTPQHDQAITECILERQSWNQFCEFKISDSASLRKSMFSIQQWPLPMVSEANFVKVVLHCVLTNDKKLLFYFNLF